MNYVIAAGSIMLALVGQVVQTEPMAWLSNIGGLGLATLLCLRIIPRISKDAQDAQMAQANAIMALTQVITDLRVHCAKKISDDDQ